MKKLYLIFFLFIILYAKEDLLKTLNEVNEIALQSKLTIDKTPSNVTVLKRDFIQKTGAKTLFELLRFVPGIQTSISSTGRRMLIIRGNREGIRDKIKFLINGESITNNLFNNQYYYYNFPTSLIKRVEITLTPDAVTYGDNAYLGVINVITLDELNDNQISLYKSNKNETIFSVFQKLNNLSFDAYYLYSNPFYKSTTTYLIDLYNLHIKPYRNISPKFLEKNLGFGIKYKKYNSTIKYRINTYKESNFFGILNLPPVKDDKYVTIIQQFLNYNYSNFLNNNWREFL
jgi:iron complex outermembrane receptor protein